MDHPSERMSPEVELRVDIALAAIVQAVHAAAPWLPADDPVMRQSIESGSRALLSAALGLGGSAYAVLRVDNRNDAEALADAVMDIMAPGRVRTPHDVMVASAVIARMAERAKTR